MTICNKTIILQIRPPQSHKISTQLAFFKRRLMFLLAKLIFIAQTFFIKLLRLFLPLIHLIKLDTLYLITFKGTTL